MCLMQSLIVRVKVCIKDWLMLWLLYIPSVVRVLLVSDASVNDKKIENIFFVTKNTSKIDIEIYFKTDTK